MPSRAVEFLVILVPLLPLLACLATAVFGPKLLREKSHWPAVIGCGLACLCSLVLLVTVASIAQSSRLVSVYSWMSIPGTASVPPFDVSIVLQLDSLSATMLAMVTFIATLVAIYAAGYMHGERGYWRFFTFVSLFAFSMIMLVLSANFVQLFMFWEAVGLCSYFLIGFWYEKPAAAAAGKKAFVVNRIGDFGFMAGIFLLWTTFGSFNFEDILLQTSRLQEVAAANPGLMSLICLCLFAGAIGKSAQFPLMVWLPDAMEGPTPVSALIHAATMVTAGVYMVARCTPLYMLAPQAQLTVSLIGGFTALLAALIALTQTDLKRVLAYSTVSQLGYMFLGLGTGSLLGIGGAMFHLVTHAFFKALLFLGAGSVMHAMGGVIDMRRFGGLKRIMPVTYGTFLVGSLALAGLFPLSGFWSKDTILSAVRHAGNPTLHVPAEAGHGTDHGPLEIKPVVPGAQPAHHVVPASLLGFPATAWYTMLFWVGIGTAFLTAFYTFRAVIMTFHGPERIPEEAGHHAHESPPNMTIPLVILAFGSAFLGLILGEWFGWFDWYLNRTLPGLGEHHEVDLFVAGVSTLVAVVGIGLAYVMYGKPSTLPARIAAAFGPLTRLSERKFYLDEIYHIAIILPLKGVAHACRFLDWILVDGVLVEFFARVPREIARLLRPVQNGLVQFYALSMMLMTAFIMWALLLR